MATNIVFNGYSFQNAGTTGATSIDHDKLPSKDIQAVRLARADGQKIIDTRYVSKTIAVTGYIQGADRNGLEQNIDGLKNATIGQDGTLDIDYAGFTRRYTVTVSDVAITRRTGTNNFASYTVSFITSTPFGQDTTPTTLLGATVITANNTATALTVTGTAPSQMPVYTLTLTSFTGSGINSVSLTNPATGQGITINRTWVAGDVIVIDTLNSRVKVNNVAVDYTGRYPYVAPGSGNITYTDTFSARSVSLTASYTKLYL